MPGETRGVTPLDDRKKIQFNLADVPTALAYCYEAQPFSIALHIDRKPPRITAETYSFLTIEPGNLRAAYEIFYRVVDAHTRELSFALPADTPAELSIQGLDGVQLKEFSSREIADGLRQWNVQLVQPADGTIHLGVGFQQRLDLSRATAAEGGKQLLEHLPLPLIRAADVEYQSGMVAVEGSPELEIDLSTPARKVDVGELVDAKHRPDPNSRLFGAYGFIGPTTSLTRARRAPEGYGVPAAVVQRGELVTAISAQGLSQTAARFLLHTKAQFLQVQLPPQSTLWSALLDNKPSKPQHDGDRLLISLPPMPEATVRDLRLVYETHTPPLGLRGNVSLDGPRLWLRERDASSLTEVPLADLAWQVHPPAGFQLADSRGTVDPDLDDAVTQQRLAAHRSPWNQVAVALFASPGPAVFAARDAYRASSAAAPAAAPASATPATDENHLAGRRVRGADSETVDWERLKRLRPSDRERLGRKYFRGNENSANSFDAINREIQSLPLADETPETAPQQVVEAFDDATESEATTAAGVPVAMPGGGVPVAGKPPSERQKGTAWALEGLRSLKIELALSDSPLKFQSLGSDPLLDIRLVDERRVGMLAWGAALVVLSLGLLLLRRSVATQAKYVVAVLIASTALPLLLGGYRPWGATFDFALGAGLSLIPIYLLAAVWRRIVEALRAPSVVPASTALVLLLFAAAGSARARPAATWCDRGTAVRHSGGPRPAGAGPGRYDSGAV